MSMGRQRTRVIPLVVAGLALAIGGLEATASSGAAEAAPKVPEAFEACISCHAYLPDEPALEGPSLWHVVGRKIASVDSFNYSTGLRQVEGHWDRSTLDRFLAAPQAFAPGINMTFGGVRSAADRVVVLDFLETLVPGDDDADADH
jgi:cytochrome c